MILALILWVVFCISDGISDAFTFNKSYLANNFDNIIFKVDIHKIFTVKRLCAIIPLTLISGNYITFVLFSMMQPFLHNGMYFYTRNKLNSKVYPKGFMTTIVKDQSSALLDFNKFWVRYILLVLSITAFTYICIYF